MTGQPLTLLLMPWGRVGSNMVNAALADLPVTVCNEPLTGIQSRLRQRTPPATAAEVGAAQRAWLEENLTPARLEAPTILNHAALSTADPDGMRDWIAARRPRLITLDRRDDAAVALSSARVEAWIAEGEARGEARNWSISRSVDFRPHIAPEILRRNLGLVREGRRLMVALIGATPVLALNYEDLVADMDGAMAALMRHAGIPWRPFAIHTRRFGTDRLSQMVANPDALARVLAEDGGATALRP